MKVILYSLIFIFSSLLQAFEYELQLENDLVNVAKVKILPHEEIGLHRDANPQVIIALQGGVITRLEADGSRTDVHFPTGQAVYKAIDPTDQLHKSVNHSETPVELIIIQLKKLENL